MTFSLCREKNLKAAMRFSCFIQAHDKNILFDTGWDGDLQIIIRKENKSKIPYYLINNLLYQSKLENTVDVIFFNCNYYL